MITNYKDKFMEPFLLGLNISLILPWTVFIFNRNEFNIGFDILFYVLIALFFIIFLFLCLPLKINKFCKFFSSSYIIFSVYIILFNFFIPVEKKLLDGHNFFNNSFNLQDELIFIIVLFFITIVFFYVRKFLTDFVKYTTLISIIVLVFVSILSSKQESESIKLNDDSSYLNLSKIKPNVILISFDGLQRESITAILKKDHDLSKEFKDFTYYTDVVAQYPTTAYSLPLMFYNSLNDLEKDIKEKKQFIRKNRIINIPKKTIVSDLIDQDFSLQQGPTKINILNETSGKQKNKMILSEFSVLLYSAALKIMPEYFVEKIPFNGCFKNEKCEKGKLRHIINLGDYEELKSVINKLDNSNHKKTFFFHHYLFTHFPPSYDSSCKMKTYASNYEETYHCALRAFSELINKLKEKNVYDNSLIIFTSDHGVGTINLNAEKIEGNIYYPQLSRISKMTTASMVRYSPVLFIKQINSTNENIMFNNIPASLNDIPPTICNILYNQKTCKIKNYDGINLLEKNNSIVNRKRYILLMKDNIPNFTKLSNFEKIKFTGNSRLALQKIFIKSDVPNLIDFSLDYNHKIIFPETIGENFISIEDKTRKLNIPKLFLYNFKNNQLNNNKSAIAFKIKEVCSNCGIEISLNTYISDKKNINVFLNNKKIGNMNSIKNGKREINFKFNSSLLRLDDLNVITFDNIEKENNQHSSGIILKSFELTNL